MTIITFLLEKTKQKSGAVGPTFLYLNYLQSVAERTAEIDVVAFETPKEPVHHAPLIPSIILSPETTDHASGIA